MKQLEIAKPICSLFSSSSFEPVFQTTA